MFWQQQTHSHIHIFTYKIFGKEKVGAGEKIVEPLSEQREKVYLNPKNKYKENEKK